MGKYVPCKLLLPGHMSEAGKIKLHKDKARTDDSSRTTLRSLLLNVLSRKHVHEHILPQSSAVRHQNMPGPSWTCSKHVQIFSKPWGHRGSQCNTLLYRKNRAQIWEMLQQTICSRIAHLLALWVDWHPARMERIHPPGALPRQRDVEATTMFLEQTNSGPVSLHDSNYLHLPHFHAPVAANQQPARPGASVLASGAMPNSRLTRLRDCHRGKWQDRPPSLQWSHYHQQVVKRWGWNPSNFNVSWEMITHMYKYNMTREYADHLQPQT